VVLGGEDTDPEQYSIKDGEETLSDNWKEAVLPSSTYVWVDRGQRVDQSPMLYDPGGREYFQHIADHPAEMLFGPRTAPK
jgi:hypothetical protein